jgi:hypothetical protein
MVIPVPEPVVIMPPGVRVIVHVPDAGNPLSCTLPMASEHFEGVIVPTTGAEGVGGWALITALPDETEVQLFTVVTVKVYEPEASPEKVVVVPLPGNVDPPGLQVSTQLPFAGKPLRATLPVL